jgi:hypothetical protein
MEDAVSVPRARVVVLLVLALLAGGGGPRA